MRVSTDSQAVLTVRKKMFLKQLLALLFLLVALFTRNVCEGGYFKIKEEFIQTHENKVLPNDGSRHIIDAKTNCAKNEKLIAPNICKRIY